jgi:hypothetical protein
VSGCCDPGGPRPKILRVGGKQIGVTGLDDVFSQVLALGPLDDKRLAGELMSRFAQKNYVPAGARAQYTEALVSAINSRQR